MTPETFEKVQQLFLEVVGLPEEQREEFIRKNADSEAISKEVVSLLKYHADQTLLADDATSTTRNQGALDATMALDGRPHPSPVQTGTAETLPLGKAKRGTPLVKPEAMIRKLDVEGSVDLSERFSKSTNQLLRSRLIISTFVLSGMLVVVTIVAFIFGDLVPIRVAARGVTLCLLAVCCWILVRSIDLSERWLRTVEVVIIVIPLVDLGLIQWFESSEFLANGEPDQIQELRAIVSTAACVYIAVYGMLIPSNWRRTAVVTGLIALLPSVISVLHQTVYDYPPEVQWMHFANPTLAAVMAVVATIGAGIVHRVRRTAESAKYFGQYQLIQEIGRGGMGVVYLGKHQMLKRPAAIKLINSQSAGSPQAIALFEKEVQATATLSHWNTVEIYDYGTTDEGDFYCVMEYLQGETLRERLLRQHTLDLAKSMDIAIQLCDGLEEAHQKGMVHRDIKPANIFLAEIGVCSDVVKILDFGLVITKEESEGEQGHLVGGTPAYMSPEQIRGQSMDGRGDIYAVGCVVYECLAGQPLFPNVSVSQLFSDQLFRTPNLSELAKIDAQLPSVLEKCLAKERDKRFENVAQLRDACRKVQVREAANSGSEEVPTELQ